MKRSVTCWMAAALLSGCASSAPVRYHTLQSYGLADQPRTFDDAPPTVVSLQVASVTIPAEFARQELMRQVLPGQYVVREQDHWAAPLAVLSRQILRAELDDRVRGTRSHSEDAHSHGRPVVLTLRISSFEMTEGMATMVGDWNVQPTFTAVCSIPGSAGTRLVAREPMNAHWKLKTPAGDSAADTAKAWSVLLGQVSDGVASRLCN